MKGSLHFLLVRVPLTPPPPPAGNQQDIDKFSRRLVKVTKTHVDECKQLLKLMGIPFVEVRSAPDTSGRLRNDVDMSKAIAKWSAIIF